MDFLILVEFATARIPGGVNVADHLFALFNATNEIAVHDLAYHQNDAPTISDADYDALRRRLVAIETQFPALAKSSGPPREV